MRINSQSGPDAGFAASRFQKADEAPSFAATLAAAAGKKQKQSPLASPAASADPAPVPARTAWGVPDAESLKASFRDWQRDLQGFSEEALQRIATHAEAFESLIDKAAAAGGYDDPLAFVRGLSPQDLAVLQHIHGLADPIAADKLSQEGALNLLLPRNASKDIDHDGFVMIGAAKTWVFPPVDAPPEVKAAWDKTVAGFGDSQLVASGYFLPVPGTSAYLGAQLGAYRQLADQRLQGALFDRTYDMAWQHEERKKQIAFLEAFLQELNAL